MSTSVVNPFQIIPDLNGKPLDSGYVYIGQYGLNPEASPVAVYWDEALTIPAALPLRTRGGYVVRNGTPARVYTAGEDYSILVRDKNNALVWSSLTSTGVQHYTDAGEVDYLPAGTGAVETTVQDKLREIVSVKDYGAVGDGVTDDTAAIQAAIDANPGRTIFFPDPDGSYKITSTIYVRSDRTILEGESTATNIYQTTANIDAIVFEPTTAGITSAYLNAPQIKTISVANTASGTPTGGTCIKFRQCNGYRLFNVSTTSHGCVEGISVEGGQFGSLKLFTCSSSSGGYAGSGSALLTFTSAVYSATRQPLYTTQVEDFRVSTTLLRYASIRIEDADGLSFSNAYIANGHTCLLLVKPGHDDDVIAATMFSNVYFDCVGVGKTPTAIRIEEDGLSNTFVYGLHIGSGCVLGNGDGWGILNLKEKVMLLSVVGATFLNFASWAIASEAGSASLTNILINGCNFNNIGDGASGALRFADTGRSLAVSDNTFSSITNLLLRIDGTWSVGTISGNTNSSAVNDINNTATFTSLSMGGNASAHTGTSATSWKNLGATASLNFGSLDVGDLETLTITVTGAKVGDNVIGNVESGSNISIVGGGALIAYFYGVIAADTVSVRAVNVGTATGDVGAQTFRVQIVR